MLSTKHNSGKLWVVQVTNYRKLQMDLFCQKIRVCGASSFKTQFLELGPAADAFDGGSKSTFWPQTDHFLTIRGPAGKPGALFGTFCGFYVVGAGTFLDFWRILRRGGEHFLGLLADFTSWERALFGTFGGF